MPAAVHIGPEPNAAGRTITLALAHSATPSAAPVISPEAAAVHLPGLRSPETPASPALIARSSLAAEDAAHLGDVAELGASTHPPSPNRRCGQHSQRGSHQ